MAIPGPDIAPIIITTVLTAAVAGTLVLRGPLGRALARRIEGGVPLIEGALERIEQLEQRVAELEGSQHRVQELEDRLEFAERVLARADPIARLQPGPAGR
jgi:hypothetical protein